MASAISLTSQSTDISHSEWTFCQCHYSLYQITWCRLRISKLINQCRFQSLMKIRSELVLELGIFPVNRLTKKNSVNRFSINRTETEKMAANLVFCKSHFICIADDTNSTLNGDAAIQQHVLIEWVNDTHHTSLLTATMLHILRCQEMKNN